MDRRRRGLLDLLDALRILLESQGQYIGSWQQIHSFFDKIFEANDCQIIKTPYQVPVANAFAESWIGSLKRECLSHFLCFSLNHMDHIVQTFANYNGLRPHQSLGNRPLGRAGQASPVPDPGEIGLIRRRQLLGGLLSH